MFKDTCAIIVTYHPDLKEVETLISRIRRQVGLIVIVDNGSGDSAELRKLATEFLPLGRNFGVATAQNTGIRLALARGFRFVLLFDHDSLPSRDMVPKLRAAFDSLSEQGVRVAVIGPNYYERNSGRLSEGIYKETDPIKVKMLISSGALFCADALRDVGPMLDELFIDYIDSEWCMRATRKYRQHKSRIETKDCWKVYIARDALMGHCWSAGHVSFWAGRFRHLPVYPPIRCYFQMRNAVHLYFRTRYSLMWKLRDAIYRAGVLGAVLVGAFPEGRWPYLRMIFIGLWDGLTGTLGGYRGVALNAPESPASTPLVVPQVRRARRPHALHRCTAALSAWTSGLRH
jgi:rhamnosyltransferase